MQMQTRRIIVALLIGVILAVQSSFIAMAQPAVDHDILRLMFKDPRVHFTVNCASKSCPPLLKEPYTGTNLNT